MRHRVPFIALSVASLLALSAGSVLANPIVGTLNAAQTSFDTNLVGPVAQQAQTFVPTVTGSLTTVQVHTNVFVVIGLAPKPAVTDVAVEITTTSGNLPTATVLATQTVTPGNGAWTTAVFTTPASVVAGTKYAIELVQTNLDTTMWDFACADNYGPGQPLILDTTWKTIFQYNAMDCLADYAFQTYIVAAPAPTTVPTNPPTSTVGGSSGDTPNNQGFMLIFAGLALSAAATVFVARSQRGLNLR